MTIEVEPASGTPLYRHPLSLARGSRAKSPYLHVQTIGTNVINQGIGGIIMCQWFVFIL